jgi:hypothetical protein
VEAEALTREALARAAESDNRDVFNDTLFKLVTILILQKNVNSREIYLLTLRLIRIHQSAVPQAPAVRSDLANGYDVLASILFARLNQENKGDDDNDNETEVHYKWIKSKYTIYFYPHEISDREERIRKREEAGAAGYDVASEQKEFRDGDEWSRCYMKMRAFYCLVSAITIYSGSVEGGDVEKMKNLMERLEKATFLVLGELLFTCELDLSGAVVAWKGITWESFIEDCRQEIDLAGRPSVPDASSAVISSVEGSGKCDGITADEEDVHAGGLKSMYEEALSFTTAESPRIISQPEYEVQMGFAYLALSNALKKSDVTPDKVVINRMAVLEEADRTLQLAAGYFGRKVFTAGACELLSNAYNMKTTAEVVAGGYIKS